jgi:hypothetical protein
MIHVEALKGAFAGFENLFIFQMFGSYLGRDEQ